MITRAQLRTLEAATAARVASRPHDGPDIEGLLTPVERAFFAARQVPLDQWTLEDREEALRILEKYDPEPQNGGKADHAE